MRRDPLLKGRSRRELDDLFLASHAVSESQTRGWSVRRPVLGNLWRDTGLTLILVTHDSSVARRAQRIGIMQNGTLSIRQDTRDAAT